MTEKQTEAHSMTMTDRQSSNTDILTEIDRQRDIDWLSVGRSDLYIRSTHLQRLYNLIRNHMTQFDKLFNSLKAAILPNIALPYSPLPLTTKVSIYNQVSTLVTWEKRVLIREINCCQIILVGQ